VIKWFEYLWNNKQSLDEDQVMGMLPDKLKVRMFQEINKSNNHEIS